MNDITSFKFTLMRWINSKKKQRAGFLCNPVELENLEVIISYKTKLFSHAPVLKQFI